MSISTAISSGLSGMQSSQRALNVSARNIATESLQSIGAPAPSAPGGTSVTLSAQGLALAGGSGDGGDLATDMVNSLVYKNAFQLSAKVVQAGDATLGSLLDIRA
jgi:flagellar basal-body rod protein FlgC